MTAEMTYGRQFRRDWNNKKEYINLDSKYNQSSSRADQDCRQNKRSADAQSPEEGSTDLGAARTLSIIAHFEILPSFTSSSLPKALLLL